MLSLHIWTCHVADVLFNVGLHCCLELDPDSAVLPFWTHSFFEKMSTFSGNDLHQFMISGNDLHQFMISSTVSCWMSFECCSSLLEMKICSCKFYPREKPTAITVSSSDAILLLVLRHQLIPVVRVQALYLLGQHFFFFLRKRGSI